jgi:anti-anti-sigma factor
MSHVSAVPTAERIWVVDEGPLHMTLRADDGEVVCLQCEGDLHWNPVLEDRDLLADFLGPECYCRKVVVNLERTRSIDSSGIGWLIACQKRFAANGGCWILHSLPPWVKQMLGLLRLDSILQLAEDETTACRLARSAGPRM